VAPGDASEILGDTWTYSADCNANTIPDNCDIDCGTSGGACDIAGCGSSEDCNGNGVPDECDLIDGTLNDLNTDGIPDECGACCSLVGCTQLAEGPCRKQPVFGAYRGNGTVCGVDINGNGVDDLCETTVPAVSEWGMVAMSLLVLTAGTLVYKGRRTTTV